MARKPKAAQAGTLVPISAVAEMGRRGGKKGGAARAARMTQRQPSTPRNGGRPRMRVEQAISRMLTQAASRPLFLRLNNTNTDSEVISGVYEILAAHADFLIIRGASVSTSEGQFEINENEGISMLPYTSIKVYDILDLEIARTCGVLT